MKKALLILVAGLMSLAPMNAAVRVVVGRPVYRGSFYYGGGFYRPYWGPAYGYYNVSPAAGEIKLDTKVKDAEVFIDGAFAGTTHDNKSMHLRPGSYNIEIRLGGRTEFSQKVYVEAGKTLHLHPVI